MIYKERSDIGNLAITLLGVSMACLITVRGITSGYLNLAEEINWKFMTNGEGEEDAIIGSRYREELIGACVLRLERNGHACGKKTKEGAISGKGLVRAWTTRIRYRGIGVGTELLEKAVKLTREKLGDSAQISFAADHANSKMVLPEVFNGGFRKREARAARALEAVIENMNTNKG